MPAVALTDFNNFFAAVKFYKAPRVPVLNPFSVPIYCWLMRVVRAVQRNWCYWCEISWAMPTSPNLFPWPTSRGSVRESPYQEILAEGV